MADLEATLALTINRDDVDSAMASIKADLDKGVQATFAKAAQLFGATLGRLGLGGGGGGGAASTGAPGHATGGPGGGAASTGAPSGGGKDGPPPSRSTGAPGDGGRRRPGGDLHGSRETGPAGSAMTGIPGLVARGSFGAGVSAITGFAGDVLKEQAQQRADRIEDGSIPGGPAAMGLLRYANPVAAVATAIGAGVVSTVANSQEANDQFAGMSRDLARGAMGGAFFSYSHNNRLRTRDLFTEAARAENGSLNPSEVAAYGKAYESGVGYSRYIPTERSVLGLRNSGASDAAIFGLMSNARLGNVDNADPSRFIGLAQSQGLAGSGLDRYLQIIAQMTTKLASQGIKIDQRDQATLLTAMRLTPGMEDVGERGASAVDSLGGMAGGILGQLLEPHKQYAQALMMQEVLAGGGSYEDVVRRTEKFAGDSTRQFSIVQKGGRLAMRAAMSSLSMDEIDAGATIDSDVMRRARDKKYDIRTADKVLEDDGNKLFEWPSVKAALEANRVNNKGSLDAYTQMSVDAAGWKTLSQDIGNLTSSVNSWASDLSNKLTIENMQRWTEPVVRAVNELKTER